MRPAHFALSCVFLGALCPSAPANSQEIQASLVQPISPTLVVGDWYDVTVCRENVTDKTSGILLEISDEWIVLASVAHNIYDINTGTPVLMYVPYVGKSFRYKKTKVESFKTYRWIPRDGMKIDRHSKEVDADIKATLKDQPAAFGDALTIGFLRDGKPQRFSAAPKPGRHEDALRELTKIVPKSDVLFVQSNIPIIAKEIKATSEK